MPPSVKLPRGSAAIPNNLEVLNLVVTSRCNLSCSYCFRQRRSDDGISWQAARAAVNLLLASRSPRVAITLLGGEPLLERGLLEQLMTHIQRRKQAGKRVDVSMTTNGLLLDEETVSLLERSSIRVQISFEGTEARQRMRGEGTFERLVSVLGRLRKDNQGYFARRVGVSLTALPETVYSLPDAARSVLGFGVRRVQIAPDRGDTSGWDPARHGELDEAFAELVDIATEHFDQTGDLPLVALRPMSLPSRQGVYMCGAPFGTTLAVDVDGVAYGCAALVPDAQLFIPERVRTSIEALQLGPVGDVELMEQHRRFRSQAQASELFRRTSLHGSALARCDSCEHRAECSICPIVAAAGSEPGRVPDFQCAFQRAAASARKRLAHQLEGQQLLLGMGVPAVLRRLEAAVPNPG